jgi:hypothetical protein
LDQGKLDQGVQHRDASFGVSRSVFRISDRSGGGRRLRCSMPATPKYGQAVSPPKTSARSLGSRRS